MFLAASGAAAIVGAGAAPSMAGDSIAFEPGVIEQALSEGQTVLVRYGAKWCSTCARQERVINALRAADPAYNAAIAFVDVDWDDYGDHAVAVSRNVPRRSTLILLKGEEELGRIVAGTSEGEIKALMDKAVSAGS
jgi:thioredoxin-like negative regulator of GroEL